jgi:Meiotically up-regulated gene 113
MKSPGLCWRRRRGKLFAYWICRADIARAGYPVKTRQLWVGDNPTDVERLAISQRCQQLQHEMLDWRWRPSMRKRLRVAHNGGFVYFARINDMIKIGFATNVARRIAGLQSGSPIAIEVLATQSGSPRLEKQLHHRFASLRQSGEWFRPGPNLLAYIEEQRSPRNLNDPEHQNQ